MGHMYDYEGLVLTQFCPFGSDLGSNAYAEHH